MKNLIVWIVLISTAAVGVAVAQPTDELNLVLEKTIRLPIV